MGVEGAVETGDGNWVERRSVFEAAEFTRNGMLDAGAGHGHTAPYRAVVGEVRNGACVSTQCRAQPNSLCHEVVVRTGKSRTLNNAPIFVAILSICAAVGATERPTPAARQLTVDHYKGDGGEGEQTIDHYSVPVDKGYVKLPHKLGGWDCTVQSGRSANGYFLVTLNCTSGIRKIRAYLGRIWSDLVVHDGLPVWLSEGDDTWKIVLGAGR